MVGMGKRTLAGVVIGAVFLGLIPVAARADEELSVRRQACQAEAKTHIKSKIQQGREFYDVVVERRKTYIAQCMVEGPQQPQSTASILPPSKPINLKPAPGATPRAAFSIAKTQSASKPVGR